MVLIEDKVGVFERNLGPTDGKSLQSGALDEPAGRGAFGRILESGTAAGIVQRLLLRSFDDNALDFRAHLYRIAGHQAKRRPRDQTALYGRLLSVSEVGLLATQ